MRLTLPPSESLLFPFTPEQIANYLCRRPGARSGIADYGGACSPAILMNGLTVDILTGAEFLERKTLSLLKSMHGRHEKTLQPVISAKLSSYPTWKIP